MQKLKCGVQELPITPHYLQNPPFPYSDVRLEDESATRPLGLVGDDTELIGTEQCATKLKMDTQAGASSQSSLVVKIREQGSEESDFFEIEFSPLSYQALLEACAEELQVHMSRIAKIRKLPNIMICKDHHVQRMSCGQELEVVLNRV